MSKRYNSSEEIEMTPEHACTALIRIVLRYKYGLITPQEARDEIINVIYQLTGVDI